ncbi:trypsin-like peptidase domain-containing protein [Bacillus sp. FJAT-49732]|uniref:Trypsin-like peptidase domain-containing protein n=1 Tax=Lederbergia citrisecunda TaxID=2833583 RepID=A0A942YMC2_9BACI|nr:trypsin-like peptidase domain-containing protein [Lederbergia citrisecunda]MBS4201319.1 trypsin-like peptidase domain-containing protein [Lederbergia citrisecunda]
MGFYDNHSPNRYQVKRGRSGFFTGLIGGIIGALLVAIIYPNILGNNQNDVSTARIETNQGTSNNNVTKNLSLDVTTDVTKAVAKAGKGVVGITNIQSANFWSSTGDEQAAGVGSGVIYKKAGDTVYIVTNNHVVEGATQLEVTLSDGTKVAAKLRGTDVWSDLAVVEINSKGIGNDQVNEFGDSDALKIGEPVLAIGNPLGLQFSGSVTQGIISGVNRAVPVDINNDGIPDWNAEVIQTDAAINPGNSGGALINIAGQVVGINSMKIAQSAVEGIGFSIPINYVVPIIEDLEAFGKVKRPAMGVTLRNVAEISAYHQQQTLKLPHDITEGIMIESVVPNSPAEKAGLREMDVIVQLDSEQVADVVELRKYLYNKKKVGDSMSVTYYRGGKKEEVTLKLTDETRM